MHLFDVIILIKLVVGIFHDQCVVSLRVGPHSQVFVHTEPQRKGNNNKSCVPSGGHWRASLWLIELGMHREARALISVCLGVI